MYVCLYVCLSVYLSVRNANQCEAMFKEVYWVGNNFRCWMSCAYWILCPRLSEVAVSQEKNKQKSAENSRRWRWTLWCCPRTKWYNITVCTGNAAWHRGVFGYFSCSHLVTAIATWSPTECSVSRTTSDILLLTMNTVSRD